MQIECYFYNCSKEYVSSINTSLHDEILGILDALPKRKIQAEINADLFWLFTKNGWSFDTTPKGVSETPPIELDINNFSKVDTAKSNIRDLCLSSTTLGAKWRSDFAKVYNGNHIQIEAQFGTVESMFKDFFGFRIATYERRLSLGIEIVLSEPNKYFSHRKNAITGMAYFSIAKNTLTAIGLDCPIWLIGIKD